MKFFLIISAMTSTTFLISSDKGLKEPLIREAHLTSIDGKEMYRLGYKNYIIDGKKTKNARDFWHNVYNLQIPTTKDGRTYIGDLQISEKESRIIAEALSVRKATSTLLSLPEDTSSEVVIRAAKDYDNALDNASGKKCAIQ